MYVACCILLLYSTSKSLLSETIMYCLCLMLTHDGTAGFLSFCFCFFTPPFVVLAASHVAVGYVVFLLCFARPSACHLRMRGIFGPRTVGTPLVAWRGLARSWSAWIFLLHALRWLLCALSVLFGAGFLALCVRRFSCSSLCGGLSVPCLLAALASVISRE